MEEADLSTHVPLSAPAANSGSLWRLLLCHCINPAAAPAADQYRPEPSTWGTGLATEPVQASPPDSPALTSSVPSTPVVLHTAGLPSQDLSAAGYPSSQPSTAWGPTGSNARAVSIGSVVLAVSESQEDMSSITAPVVQDPQSPRHHPNQLSSHLQYQQHQQHPQRASLVLTIPEQPASPQLVHAQVHPRSPSQPGVHDEAGHSGHKPGSQLLPPSYPHIPPTSGLQVCGDRKNE
jgi:hypothetical protein